MNIIYNDGLLYRKGLNGLEYLSADEVFNEYYKLGTLQINNNDIVENLKVSKISLNTKIKFLKVADDINCCAFALRRGVEYPIKIYMDKFADYCIIDNCLFYLNGDIIILKEEIKKLGFNSECVFSYIEYMNITRELSNDNVELDDSIFEENKNSTIEYVADLNLKAKLYDYQKAGFSWLTFMIRNGCGCILADEMGLGKTLQIISTIGKDCTLNPQKKYLVIAPVTLLENWKREILKFYPSLSIHVNYAKDQLFIYTELLKYSVIITCYSNVVTNLSLYNMIEWDLIVLDEAQNIKNPYAKRTKAIKELNKKVGICVTGTPFENHLSDLWSIVDFVLPGYFGGLNSFEKKFDDTIYSAASIEKYLSPIMLRRRVKEVAKDLPKRIDIPIPIQMTEEEALYYTNGKNKYGDMPNLKSMKIQFIQGLRMFCTHPRVYDNKYDSVNPSDISNKYSLMCDLVDEIILKKEKIIIFTSFNEMISIMLKDLKYRFKIYVNYINGSVDPSERQIIVDEFSNINGAAILILNPKAAGSGLNITAANHVIHYNLDWNPSLEDQASARAYRRGQEKTVFIYRLFYVDTIEEVINDRISKKREIAETAVVGNDGNIDEEDFLRILSLSPLKE